MLKILLPNGDSKEFSRDNTPYDVALSISPSLAKKAVGAKVDGSLYDIHRPLEKDCSLELITKETPEGLEILRHDCAHVLAQAVQELYDDVQITFGPATENGFYYDFYREEKFSENDFEAIEKKMAEIVDRSDPIVREVWARDQIIKYFEENGESFKAEWAKELPEGEELTIYKQGDQWLDLCRGPHMPTTKYIGKAFKLLKIAGAYWRGDASNPQLQRIYGTVFWTKKELDQYLTQLEEAKKRDHRILGRDLSLFHLQEEAIGSVFWHHKGYTIYRLLQEYIRDKLTKSDYVEVKTPQLVNRVLWEKSGHWEKFRENMFLAEVDSEKEEDGSHSVLALKPMNCPCHVQIFNQKLVSYRELPIRMSEFGSCHRYEPSGALHGIMRVRAFTQDDAHIFCTPEQIISETESFCELLRSVYEDFGFTDIKVKFSDRPEKRAGTDEIWDLAEESLKGAVEYVGIPYVLNPGEGAFYGPKLEFVLTDAIGRDWQCGTLQVDFITPGRLDASYIGADNKKHTPVMLHRAILGSFERFVGILIEQYAGRFPVWLSPVQVVVATITEASKDYAQDVLRACRACGLRVELDIRNEKINYKVREHSLQKVPYIFVVGEKEKEGQQVSVRRLGKNYGKVMDLQEAIGQVKQENDCKELYTPEDEISEK